MCNRCGDAVNDVPSSREYHAEIDGDYYEDVSDRCDCGGEYEEGYECEHCGEHEAESVMIAGWCRACVAELCERESLNRRRDESAIFDLIVEGYGI